MYLSPKEFCHSLFHSSSAEFSDIVSACISSYAQHFLESQFLENYTLQCVFNLHYFIRKNFCRVHTQGLDTIKKNVIGIMNHLSQKFKLLGGGK